MSTETVRDELRRRRDESKVICRDCRHFQRDVQYIYESLPMTRRFACMESAVAAGVLDYVTGETSDLPRNVLNCQIRNETGDCKHFEEKE